jgi:fermentation-respiration switch protein FrsA (DUF1100 family)
MSLKKWGRILLLILSVGALALVLSRLERSMVYFPARYPVGDWTPRDLSFEDAHFEARDGARLHGWFFPAEGARHVLLYLHGNAGNVTSFAPLAYAYHEALPAQVLVFDYRGYGKSEGTPDGGGIVLDARAARAWLARRTGVKEAAIALVGRSLGGGVAVELAAQDGAKALVVEGTFTSLPDVAAVHYPWLPAKWLMRHPFDSLAKIGRYQGPTLVSHAEQDEIIPFALGKRLFEAANEPKRFVTIEGGGHNDFPPPAYFEAVRDFFVKAVD